MKSMQNTLVVENFSSKQDISNRKINEVKIYKNMIRPDVKITIYIIYTYLNSIIARYRNQSLQSNNSRS